MSKPPAPYLVNVLVHIEHPESPSPTIICDPIPPLTKPNAIINFQLTGGKSENVFFTGMEFMTTVPAQFSAPAISTDGKMMMISDINTAAGVFNVNLLIRVGTNSVIHDPQITNTPDVAC